jgi:N-acyl homoserine lactone hydrolase
MPSKEEYPMMKHRIVPMEVSRCVMDKAHMMYFHGMGEKIVNPQMAWYIEGPRERIVVDTAFSMQVGNQYGFQMTHVKSIEDNLKEKLGLTPNDIDIVLYTHLHLDHCSNSLLFKNARHIVQEAELKAAFSTHPMSKRFFYVPELIKDIDFETIEGDKEIARGVSVMLNPGHTPGSQSIIVDTDRGKAVITAMCARAENFEPVEGWPEQFIIPGIFVDPIALYDSMKKIKEVADIILPSHISEKLATQRLS